MRRQHQVLAGTVAISRWSRDDDDIRRTPEDIEAGPFDPIPAGSIGTMRSRMIQSTFSVSRDALDAFDDVEGPGDLTAKRRGACAASRITASINSRGTGVG